MRQIHALILVVAAATSTMAATSLAQYVEKLDLAVARMGALFSEDRESPTDDETVTVLDDVRRLIPAKVEVTFGEGVVSVDNGALIKALEQLGNRYRNKLGTGEDRHDELVDLASQLNLLAERVRAASETSSATAISKEQLAAILARDEFQPEVTQESRLYKWTRQVWRAFIRFLQQLLSSQEKVTPKPGRASLDVVRALIALGLGVALVAGGLLLMKRLQLWRRKRKRGESEQEVREILGEEIDAKATAEDLLARAAELARQGDYRAAIRRAFIALLFELEQRGKVRLDPAKTNHDYLNEVRRDVQLVEPVSLLTSAFERVWYGQKNASSEEYTEFVERWRGAVRNSL